MFDKIKRFLWCAGKAVLPKIPKWIAKAAGADLLVDMCEVGEDFYKDWRNDASEQQARAELQAIAQPLPVAQLKQIIEQVVAELAADRAGDVQQGLTQYLLQIPGATRQALKRPADPSGTTVPATLGLNKPADVLGLLPVGLAQFTPGDRPACLHGDWELIELLGRGGQGEVWKACRIDDAEFVSAFKFCTDPDAKRQLQLGHEKAVVQRVKKANLKGVVALEDYKLDASPPWLRYELVEGGDLAGLVHEWNDQPETLRTPYSVEIIQRLAGTVGQFHSLPDPVIHRDLKPANILVRCVQGKWYFLIADFGIGHIAARRSLDQARVATNLGKSIGTLRYACTPLYASPQQQQGSEPDARDDVFALGVIWYQLVLRDLTRGAPTGLGWDKRVRAAGLSETLIQLMGECMAGDPDDRPADAQALYERLAADASPRLAPAATPSDAPPTKPPPRLAPAAEPPVAASPPPPKSESPADRVRRLKTEAAKLHEDARALVEVCDFSAAAALLEGFRAELTPLRDAALLADTISKRDRLRQLHADIHQRLDAGNLKDQRLPGMIASYLAIFPGDHEMLELAREFPAPKPGDIITNSIDMKFAYIPPGTFLMGSPASEIGSRPKSKQHRVTLTRGFHLGIHQVTQAQWQAVMGSNPSYFKGDTHPVEEVSWNVAKAFCQKLSAKDGRNYRLPTEAEWEYACRAGTQTAYSFGDNPNDLGEYAWFKQNSGSTTHPVGQKRPNTWGLFDMHGNVWEWCEDFYGDYPTTDVTDPRGCSSGSKHLLRGGSYGNDLLELRSACRNFQEAIWIAIGTGFRVSF